MIPKEVPLRSLGILMHLIGVAMTLYFFLGYQTTLQTEPTQIMGETIPDTGGPVHNWGLLTDRICGVIIGVGLMISGSVMATARGEGRQEP